MISNGIDLVKMDRFDNLIDDDKFMNKVFNLEELDYINKHRCLETVAGMYAAKEACLKALKKGINDYHVKDILILHDNNNAPFIKLSGKLNEDFNLNNISVSISHDGEYAISIVTLFN